MVTTDSRLMATQMATSAVKTNTASERETRGLTGDMAERALELDYIWQ